MKTILVTGATGFIGSHTIISLIERGFKVYAVDSNINSKKDVVDKIKKLLIKKKENINNLLKFFNGDISNSILLDKIFNTALLEKNKIKAVIHFAALKSSGQSIKNPLLYWDNNVNGTIQLLKKMDFYDCRTLVFSSSAYIYGESTKDFIDENERINPVNPYGNTKASIELILSDLYKSNPKIWKIINLRYFNPIGCHPSGLIGEMPIGKPNNIFPVIMRVASGKNKKLKIFGNDWPTKDGTCIRDFIHVLDIARAHISAIEYLEREEYNFMSLNIGTGKGTSVLDLVNTFCEVNNVLVPYEFCDRRNGDVPRLVADSSLANLTLGWIPKYELHEMCSDGWRWQKNQA